MNTSPLSGKIVVELEDSNKSLVCLYCRYNISGDGQVNSVAVDTINDKHFSWFDEEYLYDLEERATLVIQKELEKDIPALLDEAWKQASKV